MKRKFRASVSLFLTLLLITTALPFYTSAEAAIQTVDGKNVAYVSASGEVTVNGEAVEAFTNLDDAIAVLGTEGGVIRISGLVELNTDAKKPFVTDLANRKHILIEGIDDKVDSNILAYPDRYGSITILGDTTFDNLTIRVIQTKELPILANGFTLTIGAGVKVANNEGGARRLNVYGLASLDGAPADNVIINGGEYTRISGSSYYDTAGGKKTVGDIHYTINGGIFGAIYGAHANDTKVSGEQNIVDGNIYFTFNGGTFASQIYTGSAASGTVNGNIVFEFNGGEYSCNIANGSRDSASQVNGNCAVIVNGGSFTAATLGKTGRASISGKEIYIINNLGTEATIAEGSTADYIISVIGGKVYPVFDGTKLLGFSAKNSIGIPASQIFVNGEEKSPDADGIFELPEGKIDVSIGAKISVSLDKNASFISGYTDGTFKPQNNMTRAEAVTTLLRLIAKESEIKGQMTCSFTDVNKEDWFYDNIGFFEALGYLSSYSGEFLPNQNITRAEFVELLYKLTDSDLFGIREFSDVPSNHPQYYQIGAVASMGIIAGYPDGTFNPEGQITRAEVVTLINRFLGREPTENIGLNNFSDISDHWARYQIITSSNESVQTIDGTEVAIWKNKADEGSGSFTIPADLNKATDYVKALEEQKDKLSSEEFIGSIDTIAEKMKSDVLNTQSDYSKITGTEYYVSPNGNDSNDGKSPETAWATLTKIAWAPLAAGDGVLFERGGEFRGNLRAKEGITYSAYGEGAKPILNGSAKNYADSSLWKETDVKNIYVLSEKVANAGIIAFDHERKIGKYDELVGTKKISGIGNFKGYSDLKTDLEFYSDMSDSSFYLYSDKGNPGERFKSIEIGARVNILSVGGNDVTVDNIHFTFGGAHAVGSGTTKNLTVQNCLFDWIGGSILSGTTRYGNAIEIFGGCDGYFVKNNWIYQIYDTGITHQYSSSADGDCNMNNVNYTDNLIEYCHWSIEYYNAPNPGTTRTLKNVYMSGNVCRLNGYGWGSVIRMSSSTMYQNAGTPKDAENLTTEYNIFDRSAGFLVRLTDGDKNAIFRNNVYVQNRDGMLGYLFGTNKGYSLTVKEAIKTYEQNPIIYFNSAKA